MALSSKYTLVVFYSKTNQLSLNTRIVVNEFVIDNFGSEDISVTEVDYESDKSRAIEYGVMGTPAIVLLKDGRLIKRHLGEITTYELKTMVSE